MKYNPLIIIFGMLLLLPQVGYSAQDSYIGDTAIYGGASVTLQPNVLIVFDTSGSMDDEIDVQVCQPDVDSDGVIDESDNCPTVANATQTDTDNDGIGDLCDDNTTFPDTDGDGVTDDTDNCKVTSNADQADSDGDGIGDACEVGSGGYNKDTDYTAMTSSEFCGDGGGRRDPPWAAEACQRNKVYRCRDDEWDQNGFCSQWDRVENIDYSDIDCNDQEDALSEQGTLVDDVRFDEDGNCDGSRSSRYYATGNWVDWYSLVTIGDAGGGASGSGDDYNSGSTQICSTTQERKNDVAENVVSDLIESTGGVNFGIMRFNSSSGGTFMTVSVDGQNYETTIKNMDEIHTGTTTNREALVDIASNMPASGYTPLGETLYEAMRYFSGGNKYFAGSGSYTSPITASCQPNYIILMTDGMATSDSSVPSLSCGGDDNVDCDGDGRSDDGDDDSLDDVAWYLYNTDLSDFNGTQNVKTYTIGFGLGGGDSDAVDLLQDTADNGQGANAGQGKSYLASSYQELTSALSAIIGEVLDQSSAFVAPVVPTSPENKVYSGQRIYLGFFKPQITGDWYGNLKKFGLDNNGEVLDKNGNEATDANGAFLPESVSYWGTATDAGNVEEGGIGGILNNRVLSTRNIYTYTGTTAALTDSSNALTTSNTALTFADFDVASDVRKDEIINYVYGYDVYGINPSVGREWVMGDILHSKPAIQTYNSYALSSEADPNVNKTVIYVGSNDGQLHAFSDANGSELWSFVPPSVLPNLQNLGNNAIHEYFMDGSPALYVFDYDGDGNIGPGPESGDTDPTGVTDAGANDKVIMVVSMRRGGGIDTLDAATSRGSYYALDVTNPLSPQFLWEIDSTTTGFSELGETWSDAVIGKIRLNGSDKIVAFIGAGYDNNEDLRFGNTQLFPDNTTTATSTILPTADANDVTSSGSSAQVNPKGRGIYVIELATVSYPTISPFLPTVAVNTSPQKLWEYVYDADREDSNLDAYDPGNNPKYSFVATIATLDSDFDGYIDRLYSGDTGGNMWRFDIGDKTSTSAWDATKIFSANPSDVANSDEDPATNGRKIFYRPSIVQEPGYVGVYFGTGDRAHPLNKAVIDRLYAVYDRGNITSARTEEHLVNVTEDNLQSASPGIGVVNSTLLALSSTSNYGWFIKLDLLDGEKVLSNPIVFNKVAYYTTFTANVPSDDPCEQGQLGIGRLYAVDYKTGEAVFNFDLTNDVADEDSYAENENERAIAGGGKILRRSDRVKTIGSGIPSGAVVVVREDGTSSALIGCGGGLCGGETKGGGTAVPIYWMME